jgi:hypothetical protein
MNTHAISYSHGDRVEQADAERTQGAESLGPDGHLAELRQLDDCVIAEGDPDIRGWQVKTAAGLGDRTVGRVEDLVVDRETLRVRYMLVCLDKEAIATTRDRRILVPVGVGRLDEHEDEVRLDGYTTAHLVGTPEFRPGKVTRHYEATVRRRFASPEPKAGPRTRHRVNFYEQGEFDERSLWGVRRRGREDLPYLTRQ